MSKPFLEIRTDFRRSEQKLFFSRKERHLKIRAPFVGGFDSELFFFVCRLVVPSWSRPYLGISPSWSVAPTQIANRPMMMAMMPPKIPMFLLCFFGVLS